jgi:hypothetical protein
MTTTTLATPTEPRFPIVGGQQSFDTWKRNGEALFRRLEATEEAHETSQWAIGDWLVKGEKNFGETKAYATAEQITGWVRGTLYNVVSVVRRFPTPSLRSETKLRWSHFKELARIKDDKKRVEVLEEFADGFEHSVWDVRERVDKVLEKPAGSGKAARNGAGFLRTSLKENQRKIFKALANKKGKTTDELLRSIVLKYIEEHKKDIEPKAQKPRARKR